MRLYETLRDGVAIYATQSCGEFGSRYDVVVEGGLWAQTEDHSEAIETALRACGDYLTLHYVDVHRRVWELDASGDYTGTEVDVTDDPGYRRVARLWYEISGYHYCSDDLPVLDGRGPAYRSKAAALRAAHRDGYSHIVGYREGVCVRVRSVMRRWQDRLREI